MTDGETVFLFGIMILVVLLDAFACEGWFIPRLWFWIKGFVRSFAEAMADLFMLDTLRRKLAEAPVREPDWADAADEVGFFDPLPEPLWDELVLWTPAEREAFELDATAKFINHIDKVLSDHEKQVAEANKAKAWQDWNRAMDLSEEQIRAAEERNAAALAAQKRHAEKMARRNGANLLPGDDDDLAALRVLNRTRPSRERRREARLG